MHRHRVTAQLEERVYQSHVGQMKSAEGELKNSYFRDPVHEQKEEIDVLESNRLENGPTHMGETRV